MIEHISQEFQAAIQGVYIGPDRRKRRDAGWLARLTRWLTWRHYHLDVRIRYTGPIARQEECDQLRELQWRAAVQRNIERKRALKLN